MDVFGDVGVLTGEINGGIRSQSKRLSAYADILGHKSLYKITDIYPNITKIVL